MKVKKNIGFLIFLFILIFTLAQGASAAFVNALEHGTTYYHEDQGGGTYLDGHINWGVYHNDPDSYFDDTGLTAPTSDPFIYVYQIFSTDPQDEPVGSFALLDISEASVSYMGSQDDLTGGLEPSDEDLADSKAMWEWSADGGYSLIYMDDHSWLLVITSGDGPVVKDYEVRGPQSSDPLGPPKVPEPGMMALLCVGSTILYAKRKKGKSA